MLWVDNTGQAYHLFQGSGLTNADFDQITTVGATSRLLVKRRTDISVGCQPDVPVLEVATVLEVGP